MKLVSGLDLVEIKRIEAIKKSIKDRFIQRILTPEEQKLSILDQSIAGVFAAKEATAKALGCGIGEISWHDMEIIPDENGAPHVHLSGKAGRKALELGITTWSVSITHTANLAAAQVIGVGPGNEATQSQ
jgi:holo-[acyl-carrier protein] synthase